MTRRRHYPISIIVDGVLITRHEMPGGLPTAFASGCGWSTHR
jgi:hypothetical protein